MKLISLVLFVLTSASVWSQANITIEVNWPNWSSENRVTFRNPSNTQIGARICNPAACFNGVGNNSYNNIGSPASYPGIAFGTGYSLLLEDAYGDGWNGGLITVAIDGTETQYTCAGATATETITIPAGTSQLLFTYTAGDWEGENLYTLKDPSGTVILSDGIGDGNRDDGPAEGEQFNTCD